MATTNGHTDDCFTERPFAEVVTARKQELGLSYSALSRRTKELDTDGRGLSVAYLVQLFHGNEDPGPRPIRLIAGALDLAPESLVEYRLHLARLSLDPRVDFELALETFKSLTASDRERLTVERSLPPRRVRQVTSH